MLGLSFPLFADNGNRGGGHFRFCSSDASNGLSGYYFFDYLQTRQSIGKENKNEYSFKKKPCQDQTLEIADKLILSAPELGFGLKNFVENFGKKVQTQNGNTREWKFCHSQNCLESQAPLDPNDLNIVPKNCKTRVQVAVRDDWDNEHIVINVDKTAFDFFAKEEPEQCSYFFIHEWLRDLVSTDKIAELNRYLHSEEFFNKDRPSETRLKFPKTVEEKLVKNCDSRHEVSGVSVKIKKLEETLLEAYFELIKKQNNATEAKLRNRKMLGEFESCLRKSRWPYRGLFISHDYSLAESCTSAYSQYIPYEQCLESVSKYDLAKRENDPQLILLLNCQDGNWGKMTNANCLLFHTYLDKYKPNRTKSERNEDIQRCNKLANDFKKIQVKSNPYFGKALSSPIKLTNDELAEKIRHDEQYKKILNEQLDNCTDCDPKYIKGLREALKKSDELSLEAKTKFTP